MRIAFLADIHGNLAALEAVLEQLDAKSIDRFICLGDVVGYGPDPAPCLRRLKEVGVDSIQGNHEAELLGLPTGRFNQMAQQAIDLTREILGPAEIEQIQAFRKQIRLIEEDILCVHGSPFDRDEYVLLRPDMQSVLEMMRSGLCFCGHTHQQYLFDGNRAEMSTFSRKLDPAKKYLVNPGSVGQPRDGDSRAAYAIYDMSNRQLDLLRVEYDIATTAKRIQEEALPQYLADRLKLGK